ncbi:MAG: DegQ family serine endoprotease [Acidobacteriota bacterium]
METRVEDLLIAQDPEPVRRTNRLLRVGAVVGALVLAAMVGSVMTAKGWTPFRSGDEGKVPVYLAAEQRVNQQLSLNTGFSAVAKAVTPAVVTIKTESRARAQRAPYFMDPFRDFFGQPDQDDEATPRRRSTPQPQMPQGRGRLQPSGVGSGVIVSPDGYILTNNHVVDEAEKVTVELTDRRSFVAKVVGTDAPSDVAVLKIDATGLPTLPFGDSSQVEVGDVVLAVGNPLNVGQTVTMGIISAKSRSTGIGGQTSYEDFLQTDAAINRGNSGGALVNLRGELIGIPSQILSGTGGNIGIGFAIPSGMARGVMDQLVRAGKVRRAMLGVRVRSLDSDLAEQFGFNSTKGALVEAVEPGQPADQAGVKRGDIITEFQGQRIEDHTQLRNMASQASPGSTARFKVWRDGAERELSAKLVEMDLAKAAATEGGPQNGGGAAGGVLSGIKVDALTPDMARRLNLPNTVKGVVVTEVDPESSAAAAGIRRGEVIEEVARQPVTSVSEFNAALEKSGKKGVLLSIRSAAGVRYAFVKADD